MRQEVADRVLVPGIDLGDTGAVGGTLAGNALSIAAARATLERVLTEEAFARMIALAGRLVGGVQEVLDTRRLPWHVVQLGARAEYRFCPTMPRNGGESAAAHDGELDTYMHCYLMNRGVLTTPFHNMTLMSPATCQRDVDRHTEVFTTAVDELLGKG